MPNRRNDRNRKWSDCLAIWHSIDPERNRYRFYVLSVEKDLWGQTCLVQRWGRIGGRTKEKITAVADGNDIRQVAHGIFQRRMWHGYELVCDRTQQPGLIAKASETVNTRSGA
jgi:predicted DNA-binding WGR domain protein